MRGRRETVLDPVNGAGAAAGRPCHALKNGFPPFRVVQDRERWFQIVMGQKFEFDEAASEDLANRIPLPRSLAQSLVFDLRRFILRSGVGPQEPGLVLTSSDSCDAVG